MHIFFEFLHPYSNIFYNKIKNRRLAAVLIPPNHFLNSLRSSKLASNACSVRQESTGYIYHSFAGQTGRRGRKNTLILQNTSRNSSYYKSEILCIIVRQVSCYSFSYENKIKIFLLIFNNFFFFQK